MRGRQPGRPVKWVAASVTETVPVGKSGVKFEVWSKWKKTDKKLGTLAVNVGGVRWRPSNGKKPRRLTWDKLAEILDQ
jgi:hypothetical protein